MDFIYRQPAADVHLPDAEAITRVVIYSQDVFWRQGLQALSQPLLPAGVEPVVVSTLADVVRAVKNSKLPVLVIYAYSYGVASLQGALATLKQVAEVSPFCRQVVLTDELQPLFAALMNRIPSLRVLDVYMTCDLLRQVLSALLNPSLVRAVYLPPLPKADIDLSFRQRGVLRLLRQGVKQQDIARRLQIHEKTVSGHKVDVFKRLHIRGGREMMLLFSLLDELFRLMLVGYPLPLACLPPPVHNVTYFDTEWQNLKR
ncbi:response regulator transcription factor [Serratia proteamaculans]|uniref:helix-turn-helix domain-containing protein n=1 Tax=Serratia proteamaculans TaxID=28151 RepID=UPI0010765EAB|nr:LuxR C-terminal-related transcriptional regulator [Serratia proteamaculans]TFZ49507.1 response regulator transcription factor [Serratia proteamaculans]